MKGCDVVASARIDLEHDSTPARHEIFVELDRLRPKKALETEGAARSVQEPSLIRQKALLF
jgi:hypothetical protein